MPAARIMWVLHAEHYIHNIKRDTDWLEVEILVSSGSFNKITLNKQDTY